jgi:anti-anti-sigma factor
MVPEPRPADHELTSWMNAGGHMSLRVLRTEPDTVVVEVTGEIDLSTARRLDEVLQARIRSQVDKIVIDLSGVTFFSVAGLNSLLRAQLLADTAGAHLIVDAGRSRAVRRLFALLPAGFDSVANVRPIR